MSTLFIILKIILYFISLAISLIGYGLLFLYFYYKLLDNDKTGPFLCLTDSGRIINFLILLLGFSCFGLFSVFIINFLLITFKLTQYMI